MEHQLEHDFPLEVSFENSTDIYRDDDGLGVLRFWTLDGAMDAKFKDKKGWVLASRTFRMIRRHGECTWQYLDGNSERIVFEELTTLHLYEI
ncbi:hypothetical protein ACSMFS_02840 [Shewanella xiamenensis]|uniref:hypothetical protein n=1 Tax=Shewanella xiamenensis TaxID=332186 RepID=UPI003F193377